MVAPLRTSPPSVPAAALLRLLLILHQIHDLVWYAEVFDLYHCVSTYPTRKKGRKPTLFPFT
jgi:hypothetical protein